MSRDSEKFFKEFQKHLDANADKVVSQADVERLLDAFVAQYNGSLPDTLMNPEIAETSDDFFEIALGADSEKEALKYLKKALKLDPYNFDAQSYLIDLTADDFTERVKKYGDAVSKATKHMAEEGYFEDEYIGKFWGVLETRPYMRLRSMYTKLLLVCGRMGQVQRECEELLRLSENDNLGMRHMLMHVYAYFENEEAALALYKKYGDFDEAPIALPLSILYYKKGNIPKALQYLRKVSKSNKDMKKFLKMIMEDRIEDCGDFEVEGAYRPGTLEELIVEYHENLFLFLSAGIYIEWAYKQLTPAKKKK